MAIKNKPQIVPAVPSRTAGNREAAMPVEYDVHHRPRITVADGSGTPSAAPNKPGQPSSGNANAPAGQLPNIKADPKRATSPDIDSGIRLLRNEHTILEGQKQLQTGIDDVVGRLAGGNNLDDYAKVKPATDKILRTYGGRKDLTDKDKAAVVNGVNEYLRRIVVDGLRDAKNDAQLDRAKKVAVSYVTDPGPNRMSRKDRLIYLTGQMLMAQVDRKIVDDVIAQCEPSKKK
jgi:hypothetical protein